LHEEREYAKLNLVFTDNVKKEIKEKLGRLNYSENKFNAEELFRMLFDFDNYYHTKLSYVSVGNKGDDLYSIKIYRDASKSNAELLKNFRSEVLELKFFHGGNEDDYYILKSLDIYNKKRRNYQNKVYKDIYLRFYTKKEALHLNSGIDGQILEELKNTPEAGIKFNSRISDWRDYLYKKREIAQQKNFTLKYTSYMENISDMILEFKTADYLEAELKTKIDAAYGGRIYLHRLSDKRNYYNYDDGIEIGEINGYDAENSRLFVEMNDRIFKMMKNRKQSLPKEGILEHKSVGSLFSLDRQLNALKKAEKFQAANRALPSFFFDIENAAGFNENYDADEIEFLNKKLNQKQKESVLKILNTEDISLIKGPPGTGKTTVIAEACYQLAEKGKRILLSSQSNLAVDNVFAHLKNMMGLGKNIFPYRYGNCDSFEKEGELFSEENFLITWLQETADKSKKLLDKKRSAVDKIDNIENNLQFFHNYSEVLNSEKKLSEKIADIKKELNNLGEALKSAEEYKIHEDKKELFDKYTALNSELEAIEVELDSINEKIRELDNKAAIEENRIEEIDSECNSYKGLLNELKNDKMDLKKWLNTKIDLESGDFELSLDQELEKIYSEKIRDIWHFSAKDLGITEIIGSFNSIEKYKGLKESSHEIIKLIKNLSEEIETEYLSDGEAELTAGVFAYGSSSSFEQFFKADNKNILNPLPGAYIKINAEVKTLLKTKKADEVLYFLKQTEEKLSYSLQQVDEMLNDFNKYGDDPSILITEKLLALLKSQSRKKIAASKEELEIHQSELERIFEEKNNLEQKHAALDARYSENEKMLKKHKKEIIKEYKIIIDNYEQKMDKLQPVLRDNKKQWLKIKEKNSYYADYPEKIGEKEIEEIINSSRDDINSTSESRSYIKRYSDFINSWYKEIDEGIENTNSLKMSYMEKVNIIGSTCSKTESGEFLKRFGSFDYLIIDEASKATPPELMMPMLKSEKIILIGDDKQLSSFIPKNIIDEVKKANPEKDYSHLDNSLFKEHWNNADDSIKIMLNKQYRMHSKIMKVINQFYSYNLEMGIKSQDQLKKHDIELDYLHPQQQAVWIQTPHLGKWQEERVSNSYKNTEEFKLIDKILSDFNLLREQRGKFDYEIGLITFYGVQNHIIKKNLISKYDQLNLRSGTVDRFQGMESDIIIVSMVRNNPNRKIGFAKRPERVNVALSRARKLLIMIGDSRLFCSENNDPKSLNIYRNIADVINRSGGVVDVYQLR